MKYLFVIYTDIEYKRHLEHFKSAGRFSKNFHFYQQICDDPNIEVIEWGSDCHTEYKDLPLKTQEMMKWCGENKEYDYLIKCDDTVFNDKWVHYRDRLIYENIFKQGEVDYSWVWGSWMESFRHNLPLLSALFPCQELFNRCISICKDYEKNGSDIFKSPDWDEVKYYPPNKHWTDGMWGIWTKRHPSECLWCRSSDHYRGMNYLNPMQSENWIQYFNEHYDGAKYDLGFINTDTLQFYEGKFYMVSRDLSIFIGEQEKLAQEMADNFPVEDLMVGYLFKEYVESSKQ